MSSFVDPFVKKFTPRSGSGSSILFPTSIAEWNSLAWPNAGSPDYIELFEESTGNLVDEISGLTFSKTAGAPVYERPSSWGAKVGVQMRYSTADSFVGPDNSFGDFTGVSQFFFLAFDSGLQTAALVKRITQKFSVLNGWQLYEQNNSIRFAIFDGVLSQTLNSNASTHLGKPMLVGFGVDEIAGKVSLFTPQQSITVNKTVGNMSVASPMYIGITDDADMDPIVYAARLVGADADGVNVNDYNFFASHLGVI